jgi:hypothetical protein
MTTQSLPCTFGAVTTSASCRARGGAGQAGRPRLTSPHGAHPRPQHRRPGRPVEPTDEIRRRPGPPRRRAGCAARMRADGSRSTLDPRPPTLWRATACVIHVVASGMNGPVLDTYPIPANEIRTLVAASNTAAPLSPCNGFGGGFGVIRFRRSAGSTPPISPSAPGRTPSPTSRRTYGETKDRVAARQLDLSGRRKWIRSTPPPKCNGDSTKGIS